MNFENWLPEQDIFLKKKEIEIHNQYHEDLASKEITTSDLFATETRRFRIDALNKAIIESGVNVGGKILEVGAGDGWCSAYLLREYDLEEIYTMEINESAVNKLIPKVFQVSKVNTDKATIVLGSFNDIRKESYFDFVFVMGALHHSGNLFKTFKNIYNSLKPGGWLISQEPYMQNDVKNSFYFNREKHEVNFKGVINVMNNERTDIFYRECEYRVAGFHAGFDFQSKRVLKPKEKKQLNWRKKILPENKDTPNNLVIFAKKPLENADQKPVTSWE